MCEVFRTLTKKFGYLVFTNCSSKFYVMWKANVLGISYYWTYTSTFRYTTTAPTPIPATHHAHLMQHQKSTYRPTLHTTEQELTPVNTFTEGSYSTPTYTWLNRNRRPHQCVSVTISVFAPSGRGWEYWASHSHHLCRRQQWGKDSITKSVFSVNIS